MDWQRKTVLGFAMFICGAAVALAGDTPDPLWQKAIGRSNADWVAGLVITRSEIVYKGETNGVHEVWQRSSLGKNGNVVTHTVKVVEDGKDVTEEEKKEEKAKEKKESGKRKKSSGQPSGNPFAADIQSRLFLSLTN